MRRCTNCPNEQGECVGSNIKCNVTKGVLEEQIKETLKMLYENQMDLIKRKAYEVCIVSYFWHYFIELFGDVYSNMNIDMEYNRCGMDEKYYYIVTGEEKSSARPDLIIHKRLCNKNNFLFIEFKKGKANLGHDYKKIKRFTKKKFEYGEIEAKYRYKYRYGLSVVLNDKNIILTWFVNGEEKNRKILDVDDLREEKEEMNYIALK